MLNWSDPIKLSCYLKSPHGAGIYAIGQPINLMTAITPCIEYDPYMGRWPNNMQPIYVGISESEGSGVRGRLSCHARQKGNKYIRELLIAGNELWFVTISGKEVIEYEALFLCLKMSGQFDGNIRPEAERSSSRRRNKIRQEMGDDSCAYYDALDMGEHGEGM